jgi:hypothetical protein
MRKKTKQANFQRLGNILQEILKKHNINIDSDDQHVLEVWRKAVGPQIAAHTRPDKLKRNTLYVKVSSSVWMQQLHLLKTEIIEKINQLLRKELIKNIHFSIGEIPSSPSMNLYPPSFSPESFPLKDKERQLIEKSTSLVSDQELKEILKRVMTKNIIRRRLSQNRKVP